MNTALVTPDESPDLMAHAIKLADEESATVSATLVTNGNAVPTSPSSSVGKKRKLPDDGDTDSDRPARRRGSNSTMSAHGDPRHQKNDAQVVGAVAPAEEPALLQGGSLVDAGNITRKDEQKETTPPAGASDDVSTDVTLSGSSDSTRPPSARPSPRSASSEISSETESDVEYGIPYIPPVSVKLGPRATEAFKQVWWSARAPLRECHCTICLRAKSEDMARFLLATAVWEQGVLRIA